MAISPTYPGVYLTETVSVPHHVLTATTNLTAFIGVFPQGPVNEAVLVTSYPQFEQQFGTLDANSTLAAYGVWLFFENGGVGAWIVRLDPPEGDPGAGRAASAMIAPAISPSTELLITANSPGTWAQDLQVSLEPSSPPAVAGKTYCDFTLQKPLPTPPASPPVATKYETLETIPNIEIIDAQGQPVHQANVASAITAGSKYVTATPFPLASPPITAPPSSAPLTGSGDASWPETALVKAIEAQTQGAGVLDKIAPAVFNIMCIPDLVWLDTGSAQQAYGTAHTYCEANDAFLIVDPPPPSGAGDPPPVLGTLSGPTPVNNAVELLTAYGGFLGADKIAGALYYPWLQITDPVTLSPRLVPPSGAVAGVYARTDGARGVWRAPAGIEAALEEVNGLADLALNDDASGTLNVVGINCLRTFPLYGTVVWGSRTLAGSDIAESAFKYVPARRLADFIEQSLQQSLPWAVFEPNSASLWASLALEANQFMSGLFAAGAFEGATASAAYSVACDATTTSPTDIQNGIVNLNVGFAPVLPAEYVMLNIQITAAAAAS